MARANRQDVAKLAGVSTAVVSYVINNGPRPVATATRERVLAAMEQLAYRPNAAARALKLARTNVVGLAVNDLTNPFFAEFAGYLQDIAFKAGYAVMIANIGQDGSWESGQLQSIVDREVDGIIAFGLRSSGTLESLQASGLPIVSMDWAMHDKSVRAVTIDEHAGTRLALDHLIEHGHDEVAFIGGLGDPTLRYQSWLDAMRPRTSARRLKELQEQDEFNERGGYRAARRLLDGKRKRPSALFVASDVQAFGVLRTAYELRLSIPDDLAVVSFDGTVASQFTCPALSVVELPLEQMATLSFQKLFDDDEALEQHTTLEHRLVIRESCGHHQPAR
ncbi:LacI family DNA-binding transcriptional regulator [Dactylosporangium sp. AC04546]|uniref:LacI family DNA-binding transcriptional regulator n=1 Tax=Dactylosporangium sp. AC04546 TaxID=2862460 RepID=UPI001EDF8715|nr:LacI family DNA-binding transcriptional regulator [Dactylosporangium sp. AC04546]WVK88697.1 LacI family DNA-binding transcriptional regulator [Dactylosporangium sp. AC04546]